MSRTRMGRSTPRNSGLAAPDQWLIDWVRDTPADSGVSVNAETALTYSTIWQAVTVLSGDVGQMPLDCYKRSGEDSKDREIDREHPAQQIVRWRPNPWMSAQDFWESLMMHALIWGNGVAEIGRSGSSRALGLTPLLPDRTWLEWSEKGEPWIITRQGENRADLASYRSIPYKDVIHIKNLSWSGVWGMSVVGKARNSWGLGLSQEKYANKFFSNSARPSGSLESPEVLDDKAYERLRKDWEKIHQGLDNVGRVAILEQGTKFNPMSFNNRDSQWIEGRQFQRAEVASWFNLPPHMVGDMKDATFSNIEEQNRSYLNKSLMRWLVKIAGECREKLLNTKEKRTDANFFEHNTAALLRGDVTARYNAYGVGINNRILSPNEARRFENLPSYEGGNEFLVPMNMGQGGAENEPNDPTPSSSNNGQAQDANKESFRAQLDYLADVEAKRIAHEAKRSDKITGFIETFYSSAWPRRMRDMLTPWGQAERADVWCQRSLEILDQIVGTATPEQLEATIAEALKEWPGRVDALVREVFK